MMKLDTLIRSLKSSRTRTKRRTRTRFQSLAARRPYLETLEDRRLLAVAWDRVDPLGSLIFKSEIAGEIGAPVALISDDFESGSLGPQWSTSSSTRGGRVGVSSTLGAPTASGSFHLAMDTTIVGPGNLNEAVLTVDLSGITDAGHPHGEQVKEGD